MTPWELATVEAHLLLSGKGELPLESCVAVGGCRAVLELERLRALNGKPQSSRSLWRFDSPPAMPSQKLSTYNSHQPSLWIAKEVLRDEYLLGVVGLLRERYMVVAAVVEIWLAVVLIHQIATLAMVAQDHQDPLGAKAECVVLKRYQVAHHWVHPSHILAYGKSMLKLVIAPLDQSAAAAAALKQCVFAVAQE